MKIIYFICILFCFYSIGILIEESYGVIYASANDEKETFQYLGCFNLKIIKINATEIKLEQLRIVINNYLTSLNSSIFDTFEKEGLFIFNNLVCLKLKAITLEKTRIKKIC